MTETELRNKVVAQARAWIGKNEADGSHRAILNVYNSIEPLPRGYRMQASDPWCAAFVSAVGAACGLAGIIFPECACDPMIAAYKAAGHFVADCHYAAQPGDVIFYDWGNDGSSDHVGIVESSGASYYQVIEGNYSDAVKRRVVMHGYEHIVGFGLPDYAGQAETSSGAGAPPSPEGKASETPVANDVATLQPTLQPLQTCKVTLPVLRCGDTGEAVRAAQGILIAHGFSVGPDKADSDFGRNTRNGVCNFQRSRGLAVDGVIGPETWAALLGVT